MYKILISVLNKSLDYYIIQFLNFLFPLITLPFLIRIIGVENFGLLSFITSVIGFFQIVIDFGFNILGTKDVAINKNNIKKIESIYNSILFIRLFLFLICFLILILISLTVSTVRIYYLIYLFNFIGILSTIVYPIYFFQGLEKIKYFLFSSIISKFFYLLFLLFFINEENDFWKVPLGYSIINILISFLGFINIKKFFGIKLSIPSINQIRYYLIEGWHFFSSQLVISSYTNSSVFILGIFSNNIIVGYFTAFEKLISAFQYLVSPFYQAFFPYIITLVQQSRNFALNLLNQISKYLVLTFILITILIWLSSKFLLDILYGEKFIEFYFYFNVFSLKFLFVSIAYIYANLFLIAFGYIILWQKIIYKAFFLYILITFLFLYILKLELEGIIYSIVTTEFFVLFESYRNYLKYRKG